MPEIHYSERFDTQASIIRPWVLPGGRHFLIRILLWGCVFILLSYAVMGRAVLEAYADLMREMVIFNELDENELTEAQALSLLSGLSGFVKVLLPLAVFAWLVNVSVETAMHKNKFHGVDKGLFPLRFGRDELQVLVTQFIVFLAAIAVYIAGNFIIIAFAAIGSQIGGAIALLIAILTFFAMMAALIASALIFIRLSPAAAYGIQHGRLVSFEMWKKTKGYGWNIFGSYLIVLLCGYVIISIISYIGLFAIFGNSGLPSLMFGNVPTNLDEVFLPLAQMFDKTSVKVSLGFFIIIYTAGQLFYGLHLWGVGNYTADYISEREEA